jgi:hypothetical protein
MPDHGSTGGVRTVATVRSGPPLGPRWDRQEGSRSYLRFEFEGRRLEVAQLRTRRLWRLEAEGGEAWVSAALHSFAARHGFVISATMIRRAPTARPRAAKDPHSPVRSWIRERRRRALLDCLGAGPRRAWELEHACGVPRKALQFLLRAMAADGLVVRIAHVYVRAQPSPVVGPSGCSIAPA